MAKISFTPNLARHLDASSIEVDGATVRDALEEAFRERPKMRSYVLDDQGKLRQHVNIFVSGRLLTDRVTQSDAIEDESEIWIFQALSGG